MNANFQSIIDSVTANGIPSPLSELIAAQGGHESGDFGSNLFLEDNNSFGYKYVPGNPIQLGPGIKSPEGDFYAKYANISDSAKEIALWIKRRQKGGKFPADLTTITTPSEYATLLKNCGYYGDSVQDYTVGLAHYFSEITTS